MITITYGKKEQKMAKKLHAKLAKYKVENVVNLDDMRDWDIMDGGEFVKHDDGKPRLDLIWEKSWRLLVTLDAPTLDQDSPDYQFMQRVVELRNLSGQGFEVLTIGLADVLAYGAAKYTENNWMLNGKEGRYRVLRAYRGHVQRHIFGQVLDEESDLPHIFHAIANAMFIHYIDSQNQLTY